MDIGVKRETTIQSKPAALPAGNSKISILIKVFV
jgi:hypothetical protein